MNHVAVPITRARHVLRALACVLACAVALVAWPAQARAATPWKTLAEYDSQIKARGGLDAWAAKLKAATLSEDEEGLLLQREFVRRVGADKLDAFAAESAEHAACLETLLSDQDLLRHYLLGGNAGGKHVKMLGILSDLLARYGDDLAAPNPTDADVYRRMMVSVAMANQNDVKYWSGTSAPSDPCLRYYTFKTLRDNASQYHFHKDVFDWLPVEDMRFVMMGLINDQQLPWLVQYSIKRFPDNEGKRLNAYSYIGYNGGFSKDGGYNHDSFYDPALLDGPVTDLAGTVWPGGWDEKYSLRYDDPNFPAKNPDDPFYLPYGTKGEHMPWMVFEKGSVCGGLAKTYANLDVAAGIPSIGIGQPGHAATLRFNLVDDPAHPGQKVGSWSIQNDISGFWQSECGPTLCGWGVRAKLTYKYGASYVTLGQAALNDMGAYTRSYELRMLANTFSTLSDKERALKASLEVQPINLDGWEQRFSLLEQRGATAEQWVAFADEAADALTWFPGPMHDFLHRIMKKVEADPGARIRVNEERIAALQRAQGATAIDTVQSDVCKRMANGLLGADDAQVFTFSFSGPKANTIVLGDQFSSSDVNWSYSIDGGTSWTEVSNGGEAALTGEEVAAITADNDVKVRFTGSTAVHTVDITTAEIPKDLRVNDEENRLFGASNIEVSTDGGATWEAKNGPFEGDVAVKARIGRHGTQLASGAADYRFTEDDDVPARSYLPVAEWSVHSYSSQESDKEAAEKAHDGDPTTIWHTRYKGTDEKFIVADLKEERLVSGVGLLPRQSGSNGTPYRVQVSVTGATADGSPDEGGWRLVKDLVIKRNEWPSGRGRYVIDLGEGCRARFVKIKECSTGQWLSLADLSFFVDRRTPSEVAVTADLSKGFDGRPVALGQGSVTVSGTASDPTVVWERRADDGSWQSLDEAPAEPGIYRVTASVAGDEGHLPATSDPREFRIGPAAPAAPEAPVAAASAYEVVAPDLTLSAGQQGDLIAFATPADKALSEGGVWGASSDEAVATVAPDGTVRALKAGRCTATYTVTAPDGTVYTATATVRVLGA